MTDIIIFFSVWTNKRINWNIIVILIKKTSWNLGFKSRAKKIRNIEKNTQHGIVLIRSSSNPGSTYCRNPVFFKLVDSIRKKGSWVISDLGIRVREAVWSFVRVGIGWGSPRPQCNSRPTCKPDILVGGRQRRQPGIIIQRLMAITGVNFI